jgi:hypothetical protein
MEVDQTKANLLRVAIEWLAARDIIAKFLREVCPKDDKETIDHNAAAVIARLAHHNPPILLDTFEDVVIECRKCPEGWRAQIGADRWHSAPTRAQAIGNLVQAYSEHFNVKVEIIE